MYAPIVLFAFNRLEPLKACVASLLANSEAAESDIIVYVDGARINKKEDEDKVEAVRGYVSHIKGFKSLETHFSNENRGLGTSLIEGITNVINRYGRAIIVEDDIVCSSNFLSFLNQGLNFYEDKKEVLSISGETVKVKAPKDYYFDNYFAPRAGCWGWATWKDRWEKVDWTLEDWDSVKKKRREFNRWGGSDCFKLLDGWHSGKNMSWAIRFNYTQFLLGATSVFPIVSKVSNQGFEKEGTNCKEVRYNRFAMTIDKSGKKAFVFNPLIFEDKSIVRQRLKPVRLYVRIYSKLLNLLYRSVLR